MESRRVEFTVTLPAADAMRVCEEALATAGWRLTCKEDHVLVGAGGGNFSWPMGIELLVTAQGETEAAIRCTVWTRVGSFIQRRVMAGRLHRLRRLIAAQTPVSPAEPRVVTLPPLGGSHGWRFWQR